MATEVCSTNGAVSETVNNQSTNAPSSTNTPSFTPHARVSRPTKPGFEFGPYVPILKYGDKIIVDPLGVVDEYHKLSHKTHRPTSLRCVGEILPDDAILEAPSFVTPLILKKRTQWPPRQKSDSTPAEVTESADKEDDDEIQIVKVVGRSDTPDIVNEANTRYRKPENYIKDTAVASLTNNTKSNSAPTKTILAIEDYIKSSAGELLFGIGLSKVMEHHLEDRVRKLDHRIRKGEDQLILDLANTKMELVHAKQCNNRYKIDKLFRCHLCPFKTEFASVLDHHLATPHKTPSKFLLCNWCEFKTKDPGTILYHNQVVHRKYNSLLERPLAVHCCRYCQFESNSKRKFSTHINRCEPLFDKDFYLSPEEPDDYPAVTPKLITQQDIRVYEATLKTLRLAAYNPHQIKVSSPAMGPNGCPILIVPRSSPACRLLSPPRQQHNLPVSEAAAPYNNPATLIGQGSNAVDRTLTNYMNQSPSPNLLRLLATNSTANNLPINRETILQHPRAQSSFVNGIAVVRNTQTVVMAPPSQPSPPIRVPSKTNSNPNGTFVICEICDAYIENSSSFKSHMQWVHKVKIHQKVLESQRPPLNCQKCNWRYFTDQGLERHLLGSHGLVTSNMQELADNEKDSGRCTICGVRCPRKLVSHMKDIHKVNLKPAQLSYKCTVCSATFSLYRHFENHVYRVHGNSLAQTSGS